jgi:hypothetical protein
MEKLQIEQILTLHKKNKITLEKATESILLLLSVVERSEQCEHPWASVLGDAETAAICLKCGKWL